MFRRLLGLRSPVSCSEGHGHAAAPGMPTAESHPAAFPEHVNQVPLTPKFDRTQGLGKYKNYDESMGPFPETFDFANQLKITEEQVNQTYDNQLHFHMNVDGKPKPSFSSGWEKAVAYHHGLYVPETCQPTKTADDIRIAVANFSDKVNADSPNDACKYLQIEEFRCLSVHQFETQPQVAAKKCMKWWDEAQKCQWDQHKFNAGITYIEGPQMRRRRPYIFYPDFKYA
eukprot:TRINITY_DN4499_c0_g2_i1.p1 TRINITY_DN4499_c0_g2~~TRINITY_DN4499_c0_g2_i1.p1  ORF type:complete len:228 (+),score=31.92 TRINITY_DN4499_c0_g2_i1:68-751(+)